MKPARLLPGILAIGLSVLLAAPVAGQPLTGVLDSIGESVATGTPIRVSSAAFTDLNQRLESAIVQALREQGFTVRDDAPLVLTYSTAMTGSIGDRRAQSLDLGTTTPAPGTVADPAAEVKRRNPFLKAEPTPGSRDFAGGAHGRSYSLSFVLARAGEAPLWQGSVGARMTERDPLHATERLVPVLVTHVGQTLRGYSVEIP